MNCYPKPPFELPEEPLTDEEAEMYELPGGVGNLYDALNQRFAGSCSCNPEDAYTEPSCPESPECDCETITAAPSFNTTASGAYADYEDGWALTGPTDCTWVGTNVNGINASMAWSDAEEAFLLTFTGPAGTVIFIGDTANCPPIVFTRYVGSTDMDSPISVSWA